MAKVDLVRRAEIGRDRRAKTRAQIVQAARALYSEQPFESVTADDVVRQAEVARGTFYIHFRDIDDLRLAVANELAQSFIDLVQPKRNGVDDPVHRIALGCLGFIQEAVRDPVWGGLVARGAAAFPAVGQAARENLDGDMRQALLQKRIPAISHQLGIAIVIGIVLQTMQSASDKRLFASDVPAAAVAILLALGVSRREATAIVRRLTSN